MKFMSKDCGKETCLSLCFFNDTATTEIYTLSLHDALPISTGTNGQDMSNRFSPHLPTGGDGRGQIVADTGGMTSSSPRSEEHTSELQSRPNFVCRLLALKKK